MWGKAPFSKLFYISTKNKDDPLILDIFNSSKERGYHMEIHEDLENFDPFLYLKSQKLEQDSY